MGGGQHPRLGRRHQGLRDQRPQRRGRPRHQRRRYVSSHDIHNVEDGIYLTRSDALIQDNYIHDLRSDWSGPHYDGIATDGNISNIVIRHNTIFNEHGQTSAVMLGNYFGPVSNVADREQPSCRRRLHPLFRRPIQRRHHLRRPGPQQPLDKGQYGFIAIHDNFPVWSGNIDDATGRLLSATGSLLGPEPMVPSPESPGPSHGGSIPSVPLLPPAKGLAGDSGNDKIYGTGGDDKIIGANGNDKFVGLDGADKVYGGAGHDDLYGNRGVDALYGGPGNDHLYGSTGADKLFGGHGNDVLVGGSGANSLYGGGGADRFQVNSVGESHGSARDVIYDFERRKDKIDLSGIDAITSGRDNAFIFKGQGSFAENVRRAGQLKYHHETVHGISYTIVKGTVDTRPGVDFEIALRGKLTLNQYIHL